MVTINKKIVLDLGWIGLSWENGKIQHRPDNANVMDINDLKRNWMSKGVAFIGYMQ